ncbi:hypothetical protein THAOC_11566, partial [Thalassiosira oceanica]
SEEASLEMIQKRVEVNDPVAIHYLGTCYRDGVHGLAKDMPMAVELFEQAAELGLKEAHVELGNILDGSIAFDSVDNEMSKAIEHYEFAAKQGDAIARHNLGIHEDNSGNYGLARKHWMISAKLGDKESLDQIKDMYMNGIASKSDYAEVMRGYYDANKEMSSPERDESKRRERLRKRSIRLFAERARGLCPHVLAVDRLKPLQGEVHVLHGAPRLHHYAVPQACPPPRPKGVGAHFLAPLRTWQTAGSRGPFPPYPKRPETARRRDLLPTQPFLPKYDAAWIVRETSPFKSTRRLLSIGRTGGDLTPRRPLAHTLGVDLRRSRAPGTLPSRVASTFLLPRQGRRAAAGPVPQTRAREPTMTAGRPVGMPRRSSGATCSRRRTRRRGRPAGTDRGCSSSGPIETSWYLSGDKSSKQGPSAPNLADECILPRGRGGGPGHPVPTCRGSRYLVTSGGSRTRRVDWTVALTGRIAEEADPPRSPPVSSSRAVVPMSASPLR